MSCDTEIDGVSIAQNDLDVMWHTSGNRDEAANENADRLDVTRERAKHTSL